MQWKIFQLTTYLLYTDLRSVEMILRSCRNEEIFKNGQVRVTSLIHYIGMHEQRQSESYEVCGNNVLFASVCEHFVNAYWY